MNKKKIVGIGLLVLFVVIQIIKIDKTNPKFDIATDISSVESPPEAVYTLLKDACYDCHSYESQYPWYTNVAPVSWWIKGHINKGRKKLNFNLWGDYDQKSKTHKIEENIAFISKGWMPIGTYKILHPEGRISDKQRKLLTDWFKRL